jgi:meromycolic acid enoyl-[acyl-carrier-protein] reductase
VGILEGRRVLVTGVTSESSIGFAVAREAQRHGATVMVSNFGRALRVTERVVGRLPDPAAVLELDVTDEAHLRRLPDLLREHTDDLDGVVHSIAHADPATLLGGDITRGEWDAVARALQVSTYSLVALTRACLPLLEAGRPGGAVVGLTLDAAVAWPTYDWMGVAKAGLEASARYLARDLGPRGVRVNLVSAGPLRTLSASAVPGFEPMAAQWGERAPLGWDAADAVPVARAVAALLSDLFPATTGEVVHVDGGYHAIGM